jgi:glycosyltransferase involved in cell wall biosynthesis
MRQIIEPLYEQVHGKGSLDQRFVGYDPNDGKVHVLYVHCLVNGTGWYRTILPYTALNQSDSHAAIIATIHKWDFTKKFNDYDNPIDFELIEWADFIVFPTLFIDFSFMIRELKKVNQNLAFVMDVDMLHHELVSDHPAAKRITKAELGQLLKNMARMDMVTSPTKGILEYYQGKLSQAFKHSETAFELIPNLLPTSGLPKVVAKESNQDKIRIGIVGSSAIARDVLTIKDIIIEVMNAQPEHLQLVLFGWNGKYQGQSVFEGLPIEVIKPVNIMDYYERLSTLNLDVALLPLERVAHNILGKSYIKYAELAAMGIPVIAQRSAPYKNIISDEENGILATTKDQWKEAILAIPSNRSNYKEIGQYARKSALKGLTWTRLKSQALTELFS